MNGVAERTEFVVGCLAEFGAGPYDLIVSNPPYIRQADLDALMPEVRDYEPTGALDGGSDGLDAYRAIAQQAPGQLKPGGRLLVEIGIEQESEVAQLFTDAGFVDIQIRNDYAGIPRVVTGMRSS